MLLVMALMAFSALWADVVTFDFSTAQGISSMGYEVPEQSAGTNLAQAGPVTVGGVTLSAADGATPTRIWNSQGSFTLRIYVGGSITLSVAQGAITGITVNGANATNFDLIADVGDYSATGTVGSWTGNAAAVTLTHVGSKNAQVASVVVTTGDDGPGDDPEDPIDPDIAKLDSLNHLADLADGTEFQFTTDVYVNYQWNDFLWVMQLDREGNAIAGLIYGDLGKDYSLGAVIPAGWTGVKSTYKGLVEVSSPAHFKNAKNILDEDYYSAFDCTGGLASISDPAEGWENYKVLIDRVRLSAIDEHGMFTIVDSDTDNDGVHLTGFNKFGIEYPEVDPTEVYSIEGMMSIYDGTMELFPYSINADPGTRLWKVLYEGEDGNQYKLNDTLYVAAAADDGVRKLVFVTDDVDEIYYDTYAEWGYAEWMAWYPDWIALDCTGNEDLFNELAAMQVLMPGTVKGCLADRQTNPRLELIGTPVAIDDVELPELTLFQYDLRKDYLTAMGHEVGRLDGYFRYVDGVPCLCSDLDTVAVKLDFDFAPALEAQMAAHVDDCYGLLCVFTLNEMWEENSASMRRIRATDDDYFTNYTVYPFAVLARSALEEIEAGKLPVGVQYVSPAGVVSNTPHEGVNIQVTTFGDGSRTVDKKLGN